MKLRIFLAASLVALSLAHAAPFSTNGNRLAYLDSDDPFYPGLHFPKLITPQWVGEEGVEAVVILDGRRPHAMLVELFTEHGAGTLVKA